MKKYGKKLNLRNVKVDIEDIDPFSTYFIVSEIGDILTSGKNAFSINGSDLLKSGSEILIEVLDSNGNSLYAEVGRNNTKTSYREGTSIIYSIHVYQDTPKGVGTIYLLGTDSTGKIVRWKRNIEINPSATNKSKVRFYKTPSIEVIPFVNITSETEVLETTITGSFIGIAVKPKQNTPTYYLDTTREDYEYLIKRTDSENTFTSDMNGRTITLNGIDCIIQEVVSSNTLKISYPLSNNGVIVNSNGNYSIKYFPYDNPQTSTLNPFKKIGTAEIVFKNLETFTGKIYRYKVYRSSINAPYDSECISTGIFYGSELIYDTETPYRYQSELGKITNPNIISSHWLSNDLSTTIYHSPETLIDSLTTTGFLNTTQPNSYIILKSGEDVSASYEYVPYDPVEILNRSSSVYNSNFIKLYKDIEYIFSSKIISTKEPNVKSGIDFYITSSYPTLQKNKINDRKGLKIFSLSDSSDKSNINYGTITSSFTLQEDCVGTLAIFPNKSDYTLSDISIKPYTDFSYGPDVFTIRVPFDARAKNEGNKITCELFDINSNLIIGTLETVQYFDPDGITYPFNVMLTKDELNLDLTAIENDISTLQSDYLILSESVAQFPTSLDAASITYHNATYPNVESALDYLLYDPIELLTFTGGNSYETGSIITSVSFEWSYSTEPTAQTITDGFVGPTDRTFSDGAVDIRSDKTYTLNFTDGRTSGSGDQQILFYPKRYWGVSILTSLSDSDIIGLSSELSSNRVQFRTFDCSGGNYFYLAWPAIFGLGTFIVNGLLNNDFLLETRTFMNESGFSQTYYIYRSNSIQYGDTINVSVT